MLEPQNQPFHSKHSINKRRISTAPPGLEVKGPLLSHTESTALPAKQDSIPSPRSSAAETMNITTAVKQIKAVDTPHLKPPHWILNAKHAPNSQPPPSDTQTHKNGPLTAARLNACPLPPPPRHSSTTQQHKNRSGDGKVLRKQGETPTAASPPPSPSAARAPAPVKATAPHQPGCRGRPGPPARCGGRCGGSGGWGTWCLYARGVR